MSSKYRIAFSEIEWETTASGTRFKIYKDGARQLRLLEFGRDMSHPDWCITGHIGFLIEGVMEIEFDNEVVIYKAGDGITIPAGENDRHRPKAISEKVLIVFVEENKLGE